MLKNLNLIDHILAVDVETTGPDLFKNSLLTAAFVPAKNGLPSLELAVKYDTPLNWGGRGQEFFEKYKDDYEARAVSASEFCDRLTRYLDSLGKGPIFLLGHNVSFDNYFLRKLFFETKVAFPDKISHRTIDTHSILFQKACKGLIDAKYLASDEAISLVAQTPGLRHTAHEDAQFALNLFKRLLED